MIPTDPQMHHVTIRGHEVPVQVHGSAGMPVMMLPGGAAAVDGFFPGMVQGLTPTHTVIAHDRLGSGTAPTPQEPVSLRSWSQDLITVLDALDIPRAVLVGQSLGGALAAMALVDHPERIAGALLLDPTPPNDAVLCRSLPPMTAAFAALMGLPRVGGGWKQP